MVQDPVRLGRRLRTAKLSSSPGALALAAEGHVCCPHAWPPYGASIREAQQQLEGRTLGPCVGGTWKQEGHMVMEAAGQQGAEVLPTAGAVASAR